MNLCVIKGRLTRDPELTQTPNGVSVAKFSVAVPRKFSKDKQVDFFDCVAWRNTGEFIAKYFTKGQEIILDGEMQSRQWTYKNDNKRTQWEFIASNAEFCGDKKTTQNNGFEEIEMDGDEPF